MKLNEIVSVTKPTYQYLRLIPTNSVRNTGTHNVAKAIAGLYRDLRQQVNIEEERVFRFLGRDLSIGMRYRLEPQAKVLYMIYLEHHKVEFYFMVPTYATATLKERMSDAWGSITIEDVDEWPALSDDSQALQLVYRNEDPLSLAIDRRDNDLLRSTLNVLDTLELGDRAAVFYNFMPTSQFGWSSTYRETLHKVKHRIPVDRDKFGLSYLVKRLLGFAVVFSNDVASVVGAETERREESALEAIAERIAGVHGVSKCTGRKATASILNVQIVVAADSPDRQRQANTVRSLAHAYDSIAGDDNSLVAKPFRKSIQPDAFTLGAEVNKMGELECQHFIALPGREILAAHGAIEHIEVKETEVPQELRAGTLCIGTNTYRGNEQRAYLCDDKEFKFLSTVIIGPNRSGKTTLMQNLVNDALKAGECVIVVDYIRNCELSEEIAALFPREKVMRIDCRDFSKLQGLGYNEIRASAEPFQQWENAKRQSALVYTLLNSVNDEATRLTSKMERYLASACLSVFLSGGSLKDVFRVLQDHAVRADYVRRIPTAQHGCMEEYRGYLGELDDFDKDGAIVGSKEHLVSGIIDRLTRLKVNTYLELMLDKGTAGNVDLVEEFQKSQLICLQMPEAMFPTDQERDLYATYWMTKIWCALQVRSDLIPDRAQMTKVNLVIDELYQVRNCEKFLATILSRLPKFGLKPILSCHYINQIHQLREELRSASPSYMLLAGCDKRNFQEMREELAPFELEDLLGMRRFHSLNLVKTAESYSRFITKLPKQLS